MRRGFTLIELIIVLVISGVLMAAVMSLNAVYVVNAKRNDTANAQQSFAGEIDAAIAEIGFPKAGQREAEVYLHELGDRYLSFGFELSSLSMLTGGFTVESKDFLDGFGSPYTLYFSTAADDSRILLISPGADMKRSGGYTSGSFGDDQVLIVKER